MWRLKLNWFSYLKFIALNFKRTVQDLIPEPSACETEVKPVLTLLTTKYTQNLHFYQTSTGQSSPHMSKPFSSFIDNLYCGNSRIMDTNTQSEVYTQNYNSRRRARTHTGSVHVLWSNLTKYFIAVVHITGHAPRLQTLQPTDPDAVIVRRGGVFGTCTTRQQLRQTKN